MVTINVYHNVSRDGMLGLNWRPASDIDGHNHPLVWVFTYAVVRPTSTSDQTICEDAFEMFNVGEGPTAQKYRARRLRSLSVGDVIGFVDGQHQWFYSVESCGWKRRERSEIRILTAGQADTAVRDRFGIRKYDELTITVPLPD